MTRLTETPDTLFSPPGGGFVSEEMPARPPTMPESLDHEARLMADAAADFLRGEVLPLADRLQHESPDHDPALLPALLRRAAPLGLLGLDIPDAYGGLSLPKRVTARITERLAIEPSFAVAHNVHTSVATLPLVYFGTEAQKHKYLPSLADGTMLGAYALSEAHAGSDAMAARTRAVPDGTTYRLTGEKMWITNAAFADLFTVFAMVMEGDMPRLTAFLVERGTPGVVIGREEHKLGLRGSSTCRLRLEDAVIPAENRLGAVGEGGKIALYTLNLGRFKIAASSVGQAKNLLGIAARYADERTAFGRPIGEFGLVAEKLTRMAAHCYAAETMLYRVAGLLDDALESVSEEAPDAPARYAAAAAEYAMECALVKVACTETLDFCADECLQIHGGYGFSEEYPAARAWRDGRINRIYEGTNEINRMNMVQIFLRRLEKGLVTLPDSANLTADTLRLAHRLLPDVTANQELWGAVANLLLTQFTESSVQARQHAVLSDEASVFPAFAARREATEAVGVLLEADTFHTRRRECLRVLAALGAEGERLRERYAALLNACPPDTLLPSRRLAAAVRTAQGYPWLA